MSYRDLLLAKKSQLQKLMKAHEELQLSQHSADARGELSHLRRHPADAGSDTFAEEFAADLTQHDILEIQEIEAALERLDRGTYGICESCEEPISEKRLIAIPETRTCVSCQTEREIDMRKKVTATPNEADFNHPLIQPLI